MTRDAALIRFYDKQLQRGWQSPPHDEDEASATSNGHAFVQRGFSVKESANWPKPPDSECPTASTTGAGTSGHVEDKISGNALNYARLIFANKVEFIHNFKVAGVSLMTYLKCEYGKRTGRGKHQNHHHHYQLSVMATRDPISRFASGIGELLRRYLMNQCPGQPCWKARREEAWLRPGQKKYNPWVTAAVAAATQTRWYPATQQQPHNVSTQAGLTRVVEAFVDDLSCGRHFFDYEHLMSQSVFAATAQHGLDLMLRTEDLNAGLRLLHKRLTGKNRVGKRCPLMHRNMHRHALPPGNPRGGIPGTLEIEAEIWRNQTLVRRLCTAFIQDYICFGYTLPDECADLDPLRYSREEL